ncbi:MerR family transcriptional regulator [Niameybacter massiliensis]|uniref:MerR family transcriptional regulator n=1 Tax=Holtiella tumoricola TaxID=3018743 RepID=A0AA42DPN4_9FIRM|nr:MerR family transcriptional regulator [Holtiella tumoricola]MDA3732521.1 MerR family transcriptional regulator [Holtiella tumoricola]
MQLNREEYFFEPRYTRGQVCKVMGIGKDTLRHYESCGILSPKENKKNKYKYYAIADIEILNVILFLRSIDVPIQDIPKFIECNDIDDYSDLIGKQIKEITQKINYWTYAKKLLCYFQEMLEEYKENPNTIKYVEQIVFRFNKATFDYKMDDIEEMMPSKKTNRGVGRITQLKIVGQKWIYSNREDTSDIIVGHLCDEKEKEEGCEVILSQALLMTTLEPLDKIPGIICSAQQNYEKQYVFEKKVYIIEHSFFNIFNQGKLMRNIYLPIQSIKK